MGRHREIPIAIRARSDQDPAPRRSPHSTPPHRVASGGAIRIRSVCVRQIKTPPRIKPSRRAGQRRFRGAKFQSCAPLLLPLGWRCSCCGGGRRVSKPPREGGRYILTHVARVVLTTLFHVPAGTLVVCDELPDAARCERTHCVERLGACERCNECHRSGVREAGDSALWKASG